MSRVLWSLWAEVDEARLVRMEGESIPCEPLAEDRQNTFGVDDVVERHQRVVGKPDKGALPSQTRFHLSLEPFVQHVVQEDVREARRDYTPLRGALVWRSRPSATAPAFSHLSIILRMTPSVTRWSRNVRRWECGIESKYLRMSISSTQ